MPQPRGLGIPTERHAHTLSRRSGRSLPLQETLWLPLVSTASRAPMGCTFTPTPRGTRLWAGPGGCEDPQDPGARSTIHSDKPQDVNVPRDRTGAGGSPVAERVWGLWLRGCTPKTRRNSEQAAAREALTVGKVKEELDGNCGEECEAAVSRNKAQVTPRSDNAGPGDGQGRSRSYSVNDHCRKMSTAFTC